MSDLTSNLARAEAFLERFRRDGIQNLINGETVPNVDGRQFDTISPIDLAPLAKVARGSAADIDRAAKAAKAALSTSQTKTFG